MKKKNIIIIIIVAVLLLGSTAALLLTANMRTYNKAIELVEDNQYEVAYPLFKEIPDYEDSANYINNEDNYQDGLHLLEAKKYTDAEAIFENLGDYRDSDSMRNQSIYGKASELLASQDYDSAYDVFMTLGDYSDSCDMANEALYQKAAVLMDEETYFQAVLILDEIQEYTPAVELKNQAVYTWFKKLYSKKHYEAASIVLQKTADKDIVYDGSVRLYAAGKYEFVLPIFDRLDGYKKSAQYIEDILDQTIQQRMYKEALIALDLVEQTDEIAALKTEVTWLENPYIWNETYTQEGNPAMFTKMSISNGYIGGIGSYSIVDENDETSIKSKPIFRQVDMATGETINSLTPIAGTPSVLSGIINTDYGWFVVGESNFGENELEDQRGYNDGWALQINIDGEIVDQRPYGIVVGEALFGAVKTEKGYIAVGGTGTPSTGISYKTIRRGGYIFQLPVFTASPRGYSLDNPSSPTSGLIVLIEEDGKLDMYNGLGGSGYDHITGIEETSNGKLWMFGKSTSHNSDFKGITDAASYPFICELEKFGNDEWTTTCEEPKGKEIKNLVIDNEGGAFVIGEYSDDETTHPWFSRVNDKGEFFLEKQFTENSDIVFSDGVLTEDGNLILCGKIAIYEDDIVVRYNAWLGMLSDEGELLWQWTTYSNTTDIFTDIYLSENGDYILSGYKNSSDTEYKDGLSDGEAWLVTMIQHP